MSENIEIKKASVADLEQLLLWGRKLYEVEKQFEPLMIFSDEEARSRYEKQINDPQCLFLIAEVNQIAIGYLYAHLDKVSYLLTDRKECNLEVIYLEENMRGKGISRYLIENCIEWAKANNALRIKTDIFAKNSSSIKAFEKSWFSLTNTIYTLEI